MTFAVIIAITIPYLVGFLILFALGRIEEPAALLFCWIMLMLFMALLDGAGTYGSGHPILAFVTNLFAFTIGRLLLVALVIGSIAAFVIGLVKGLFSSKK